MFNQNFYLSNQYFNYQNSNSSYFGNNYHYLNNNNYWNFLNNNTNNIENSLNNNGKNNTNLNMMNNNTNNVENSSKNNEKSNTNLNVMNNNTNNAENYSKNNVKSNTNLNLMNNNTKQNNNHNNETIKADEVNQNIKFCGIINYGNNCYLNSGLQILASCNKLVKELEKYKSIKNGLISLINDAFYKILKEDIYDPINILVYFCHINKEIILAQYCSQNFIRKILKNLNDELIKNGDIHYINEFEQYKPRNQIENQKYIYFINANKNFPESMALNLFTGIYKYHSYGICQYCKLKYEDYSFSYFIDQNIYLDNVPKICNFSKVLFENIGKINCLTMNCKNCKKEINIKEEIRYIKLPEILIFTLERYQEIINNTEIKPDEIIDMKQYLDNSVNLTSTNYELFAINIRYGSTRDFGHEICQIKRNGEWYEINDTKSYKKTNEHSKNLYGLFYRRL